MSTLRQELRQGVASPREALDHARQASDSRRSRHQDQHRPTSHR